MLGRARRACYGPASLRELPAGWRVAFEQSGDELCLKPAYRTTVRFLEQDIRRSCPDGQFDLVLCRNLVFTYFDISLQRHLTRQVSETLIPGGLLLLGTHESLPQPVAGLVQERRWLWRRKRQ